MIKKRSIKIVGHKTSVSLEEPFWDALKAVAAAEGLTPTALIERIDRERGEAGEAGEAGEGGAPGNLSSALRLHVLQYLRAKAGV